MIVVPTDTVVTTPVLDTVATAVFEDVHGVVANGVPEPVKVELLPIHAFNVPLIVGSAFTVKLAVMTQPFEFLYVMVEVPALTPVTTPVLETVATAVLDEVHGVVASAVAEPVSVDVCPTQATSVPLIVGSALTVKLAVLIQPLEFL